MKHTVHVSLFALVGMFGFLAGCSGSDQSQGSGEPGGPEMTIGKGCLQTKCDIWKEDREYACGKCLSACSSASYDCDSDTACESSCSQPTCTSAQSGCAVEGYEVTLPNNPSPEVAAACRSAIDHVEECGYEASPKYMCDTFAAVEQPTVVAQYDCVAKLSCEAISTDTSCSLPPSSFGDQVCAKMSAVCGEFCDSELQAALNSAGAWLRSDVTAAAMFCTQQSSCGDAQQCLSTWANAVGL